jgi:hypothetical protein
MKFYVENSIFLVNSFTFVTEKYPISYVVRLCRIGDKWEVDQYSLGTEVLDEVLAQEIGSYLTAQYG